MKMFSLFVAFCIWNLCFCVFSLHFGHIKKKNAYNLTLVTKPFSLLKWKFVDPPLDPDLHTNIHGLGEETFAFDLQAFGTFVVQMWLLPESFTYGRQTHASVHVRVHLRTFGSWLATAISLTNQKTKTKTDYCTFSGKNVRLCCFC